MFCKPEVKLNLEGAHRGRLLRQRSYRAQRSYGDQLHGPGERYFWLHLGMQTAPPGMDAATELQYPVGSLSGPKGLVTSSYAPVGRESKSKQ